MLAVLTMALALVLVGTLPIMARQSYLEDALSALQTDKRELARGPVDKSGHRTKATRLINEAITEIQKAIRYDEHHATAAEKQSRGGKSFRSTLMTW